MRTDIELREQVNMRLPSSVAQRMRVLAAERNLSLQEMYRVALEEWIEGEEIIDKGTQ